MFTFGNVQGHKAAQPMKFQTGRFLNVLITIIKYLKVNRGLVVSVVFEIICYKRSG